MPEEGERGRPGEEEEEKEEEEGVVGFPAAPAFEEDGVVTRERRAADLAGEEGLDAEGEATGMELKAASSATRRALRSMAGTGARGPRPDEGEETLGEDASGVAFAASANDSERDGLWSLGE